MFVFVFFCLSVVNFSIHYNFWTIRDRDFIFGMRMQLMTLFQMTQLSLTLTLTFSYLKSFFDFVAAGA